MSPERGRDLGASVRARLLNLAKAGGSDFNGVLVRYALERLLYRLSRSAHADRFLLKGAMLFTLWYAMPHRPTRDVDLLGLGASDLESVTQTFRDIASVAVEDGIRFDLASVEVHDIREHAAYPGARVFIAGELAGARLKLQVDVGYGDVVTPAPVRAVYPVLLDEFPAPTLQTYPVYTVIAEKLHAIALLGMTNTRLKDYLDLSVLLERETLDSAVLAVAIAATFKRRGMQVPAELPSGLSEAFAMDASRQSLWRAFLNKNRLAALPLPELLAILRCKLWPALEQAASLT